MTLGSVWARLRFLAHRQGAVAGIGLLLIALALVAQGLAVQPLQAEALRLQAETDQLRQQRARTPLRSADPVALDTVLLAQLPAASGALQAVAELHRSAAAHGVVLSHGEYRLVRDPGARWQRYQVNLPARASYPALRAWLADAMNTVPGVALDELGLRREDAGQAQVEARLRFTFFLRAE